MGPTLRGRNSNWVIAMLSIRKSDPPATVSTPPLGGGRSVTSVPSVIGADLSIVGNLVSTGQLHIDGAVQGDIQGVNVLVRETAKVTGTISGQEVIVQGEVLGSVKADRVVLAASCKLEGDVFHQSLSIEQGAYFEGKSRRGSPPAHGIAHDHDRPPFVVDNPASK